MTDRDRVLVDEDSHEPKVDDTYDTAGPGAGTAGGAIGGAAAGAIAGTVIGGPIGTAVGAAIGAVGGAVAGRAAEDAGDGTTRIDPGAGGFAGTAGLGVGGGVAPMAGGAGVAVGGLGFGAPAIGSDSDVRLSEADIERRGGEQGPFDHPAKYDETAAEVAKERPILVSDDPGYEAVDTDLDGERSPRSTTGYIRERDDLAQGGQPG